MLYTRACTPVSRPGRIHRTHSQECVIMCARMSRKRLFSDLRSESSVCRCRCRCQRMERVTVTVSPWSWQLGVAPAARRQPTARQTAGPTRRLAPVTAGELASAAAADWPCQRACLQPQGELSLQSRLLIYWRTLDSSLAVKHHLSAAVSDVG